MTIHKIVACKGTGRRWGPPKEFSPAVAPYRRSLMKIRTNQEFLVDPEWESYDMLSQRQIIRKSPACRVNITMFAAMKPTVSVPAHDQLKESLAPSNSMPSALMPEPVPESQLENSEITPVQNGKDETDDVSEYIREPKTSDRSEPGRSESSLSDDNMDHGSRHFLGRNKPCSEEPTKTCATQVQSS